MSTLQLWQWIPNVDDTLGPGRRVAVWVQGCTRGCPGCMVPESWLATSGRAISVADLLVRILAERGHEGLTVSGGEPFEQPEALAELLRGAQAAGWNTWVYTGFRIEELVALNDQAVDAALAPTDVLVDGPYERHLAGAFAFRGSSNQRILRLTETIDRARVLGITGARVQVSLNDHGEMVVVGIPPPQFLPQLHARLRASGIAVNGGARRRSADTAPVAERDEDKLP